MVNDGHDDFDKFDLLTRSLHCGRNQEVWDLVNFEVSKDILYTIE